MKSHKERWEIRNQNIKGNNKNIKGNIQYKVLLMVSEYEIFLGKRSNAENALSNYLFISFEIFYF